MILEKPLEYSTLLYIYNKNTIDLTEAKVLSSDEDRPYLSGAKSTPPLYLTQNNLFKFLHGGGGG